MTTVQIKSEIEKVLNQVPEDSLQDILDYLKAVQSESADKIKLSSDLKKILAEDRALLKRLAE